MEMSPEASNLIAINPATTAGVRLTAPPVTGSPDSDTTASLTTAREGSTAQPPTTSRDSDPLALIKAVGEAATVFIGVIATGGFSYLQGFFGVFRLSLWELNFPLPVVAMIGFSKLAESWVIPAIAAGSALIALSLPRRLRQPRGVITVAIVLYATAVAFVEKSSGYRAGTLAVLPGSGALPYVAFASKAKNYDAPRCVEYETLGSFDCKLIGHLNSNYYFFEPLDPRALDTPGAIPINITVHVPPESEVIGVKMQGSIDAARLAEGSPTP